MSAATSAADAIELTRVFLREIARRSPEVLQHSAIEAFILNEINPALVRVRALEKVRGEPGQKGRAELAELAYARFKTAVDKEGQAEPEAFTETLTALLELQDEAWLNGLVLDA